MIDEIGLLAAAVFPGVGFQDTLVEYAKGMNMDNQSQPHPVHTVLLPTGTPFANIASVVFHAGSGAIQIQIAEVGQVNETAPAIF